MRRAIVVLVAGGLVFLALGAKGDSPDSVEAELRALRAEVAALQKRLEKLEKQIQLGRMPRGYSRSIPPMFFKEPGLPKGWQKKEFNGVPYYVIPLQGAAKKGAPRARGADD